MPAVSIKGMTKAYDGRKVLDDLSFDLDRAEIAAVLGRSGSGKTTLLACILGFVEPDSGEVVIDGKDVSGLTVRHRHIAYVPQDFGLFPHLDVAGNVGFGLAVRGAKAADIEAAVSRLLALVELPADFAHKPVSELSGGQRQRVALARALAVEPRLFLMDEPLSAIDAETKTKVATELRALIKRVGVPAIIVTHDPAEVGLLSDSRWQLERGKLARME
ncbi:MAG TPA: ABC transporter ATP-binding protein [Patescibacteria group bacterium]|nr:ABC transporter ATP-binding protein [Patescibacteria group bacterium]